jgi:predicted nucleic-acid-binding Zn-ribbon protein
MRKLETPKKWFFTTINSHIKCDTPGCDYKKDVDIQHVEVYLAIKCPKCGAPLLTVEDWNTMVIINKILAFPPTRFINWVGKKLHLKKNKYKVNFNGTGNVTYEEVVTK